LCPTQKEILKSGKRKDNFLFQSSADIPDVSRQVISKALLIQSDKKVSVHLMITIQNTTWLNLAAWQPTAWARGTLDSH
jgi:hypothetical protein